MKENGWGIQEMLVLCFIIGVALFISVSIFNQTMKPLLDDNKVIDDAIYEIMEGNLKASAVEYIDDSIYKQESLVITADDLIKGGYITMLDDPNSAESCDGYVVYEYGFYKSYITCNSNYTTSGYNSKMSE